MQTRRKLEEVHRCLGGMLARNLFDSSATQLRARHCVHNCRNQKKDKKESPVYPFSPSANSRLAAAIRGLRIAAVWSNLMSRQAKFELELTNVDELKEKRYSRLGHKAGHGWTKRRRMTFPDSLQDTGTCS